ncbi:SRPBCC domain-containing protein [Mucilaginibacter ximonensis]|uniref:SRPBCC domain-containing protein n=2 Tax=Mucilaginibacter ximonensis TaxID=538021 RepID=A0ABW5Y9S2_9SPHI
MNNYQALFTTKLSQAKAKDGICRVQNWWSADVQGHSADAGDTFRVRFGKTWADIRITEEGPQRLVWTFTDCYLNLLKDPQEWKNTRVIWELIPAGDGTELTMTHEGLTPALECFEDCRQGWDFFVLSSLRQYLETGKGLPAAGIHARVNLNGELIKGTLYYKQDPAPTLQAGDILIDVKTNAVEEVTGAFAVLDYRPENFDPQLFQGDNYMVISAGEADLGQLQRYFAVNPHA